MKNKAGNVIFSDVFVLFDMVFVLFDIKFNPFEILDVKPLETLSKVHLSVFCQNLKQLVRVNY